MTLVAGVDSSTQSTKVEIRDLASGEVVATARESHPVVTPPRSEQDPTSWWQALTEAFSQIGSAARDIAAISVGGQQHGLVVLDHTLNLLGCRWVVLAEIHDPVDA